MSRTKLILRFCVAACLFLCLGSMAYCQSKKETKTFLKEKYAVRQWKNPRPNVNFEVRRELDFVDDKLVLIYESRSNRGTENSESHFALSALNPNNIEIMDDRHRAGWKQLYLFSTDSKKKQFPVKGFRDGKHYSYMSSGNAVLNLEADDRTMRQLAHAFKHLITLCGGKGELFEP